MCIAVKYKFKEQIKVIRFSQPFAKLPILTKNKEIIYVPWGRRIQETGNLPVGGWVDFEILKHEQWENIFKQAVKIPVLEFLEKDIEERTQWFPVTDGKYLHGIYAKYQQEQRIYVVTITPTLENSPFCRWPRIISSLSYC